MRKIFIAIYNVLLSIFVLWFCFQLSDSLMFRHYPSVSVMTGNDTVTHEKVKRTLDELASNHHSTIVRQIEIADDTNHYQYEYFGIDNRLDEYPSAKLDVINASTLFNNYYILSGNLSTQKLKKCMLNIGFMEVFENNPDVLSKFTTLITTQSGMLWMIISSMSFLSFVLIEQIKNVKEFSIRLISGEQTMDLLTKEIMSVTKDILYVFFPIMIIIILGLLIVNASEIILHQLIISLCGFNGILWLGSVFILKLTKHSLSKSPKNLLIKGKFKSGTIKAIVGIMQILAIVLCTFGLTTFKIYLRNYQDMEQGSKVWQQHENFVNVTTNRQFVTINFENKSNRFMKWFEFMEQKIKNDEAMLVKHSLVEENIQSMSNQISREKTQNIIYVSPLYINKAGINVSNSQRQKINHLNYGETVLLVPENQNNLFETTKKQIIESLSNFQNNISPKKAFKIIETITLASNKEYFIFNQTSLSSQQFIKDPIFVVVTPQSLGKDSYPLWMSDLNDYMVFDNMQKTKDDLRYFGLMSDINDIENSAKRHRLLRDFYLNEIFISIVVSLFAMITGFLVFSIASVMYFETFRREIFIKRINGLRFVETHYKYMMLLMVIFSLSFIISVIFTHDLLNSSISLVLFMVMTVIILIIQNLKEKEYSVQVAKGG